MRPGGECGRRLWKQDGDEKTATQSVEQRVKEKRQVDDGVGEVTRQDGIDGSDGRAVCEPSSPKSLARAHCTEPDDRRPRIIWSSRHNHVQNTLYRRCFYLLAAVLEPFVPFSSISPLSSWHLHSSTTCHSAETTIQSSPDFGSAGPSTPDRLNCLKAIRASCHLISSLSVSPHDETAAGRTTALAGGAARIYQTALSPPWPQQRRR